MITDKEIFVAGGDYERNTLTHRHSTAEVAYYYFVLL